MKRSVCHGCDKKDLPKPNFSSGDATRGPVPTCYCVLTCKKLAEAQNKLRYKTAETYSRSDYFEGTMKVLHD